jgi:hypothetical protein
MKQPVKCATLFPISVFDENVKGLTRLIDGQEVAYREVMGRPSPEPFPEGTVAHEQWTYRKGHSRGAETLASPRAKPQPKKKTARHGRKPVGA